MSNTKFDEDFAASARKALMENPGLGQGQRLRAQAKRATRQRQINMRYAVFGAFLGVLIAVGNQLVIGGIVPYDLQTGVGKTLINLWGYALFGVAITVPVGAAIAFLMRDYKLLSFALGCAGSMFVVHMLTTNL